MKSGTGSAGRRAAAWLLVGAVATGAWGCASREAPRHAHATPDAPGTARGGAAAVPEARVLEAEAEARAAAGDLFGAIDLLERAIALRESVPDHDRIAVAEALERLADLLEAVDRPGRSSSLVERALEIRTTAGEAPDDKARALAGLAWVLQQRGRTEEAEHLHRRAIVRLDEVERTGGSLPERALRARLDARLGRLLRAQGRDGESLAHLERAAERLDPERPEERLIRAAVASDLAAILVARDRYDAAAQQLARALATWDALLPDDAARIGETAKRLALVSLLRGDAGAALALLDRAIAIAERTPETDAGALAELRHHRTRAELAHAERQLAQDLAPLACAAYAAIVARLEAMEAPDAGSLALGVGGLAECALRDGRPEEAESRYRRAVAALESAAPPEPVLLGTLLENLASLYVSAGRHEEAVPVFERALAAYDAAPAARAAAIARALYHAGNSYLALGRRPEALVRYVRALSLREEALPADHPELARSLDSVGAMLLERGDPDGARPLLERAVAIHERGVTSPVELGASLSYLGRVQARQGDPEAARETLARSVALLEPALGRLDPLTLATRAGLEKARASAPADRAQ